MPLTQQTLLFDADDTLWENNLYFERAIASFISLLDHRVHTPQEVRGHLNAAEQATIAAHGYGLKSFRRSLVNCFEQLSDGAVTEAKHSRIVSFVDAIAEQQMELLPGVAETLQGLAQGHTCLLVTKGDPDEQREKLERSGLAHAFTAIEVLREKHRDAYRDVVERHGCNPQVTWMIGNSPKSDINPALAAGLHAVFIRHEHTWVLEHQALDSPPAGQTLLQLQCFPALAEYFHCAP